MIVYEQGKLEQSYGVKIYPMYMHLLNPLQFVAVHDASALDTAALATSCFKTFFK